ncbi:MAG: alanine racemase [Bacilli bacterium]
MRAYITLSMNNLLDNYSKIYKENPTNLYLVVKANAYGHGLTQITSMLSKVKPYGYVVSTIQEALTIRKQLIFNNVLLLTPYDNLDILNRYNIEVLTSSKEYTEKLINSKYKVKMHAMIETGMNRDGITKEEFFEFIKKQEFKNYLKGICTHIYDINEFDNQLKCISDILKEMHFKGLIHIKSSSSLHIKDNITNSSRIGLALYGLYNDYKPVLRLTSKIIRIQKVFANSQVGYGNNLNKEDGYIYTIGFGYADGWPKDFNFNVYIGNEILIKACPMCMDFSMFFSSKKYDKTAEIEIIGKNNTVIKLAKDNNMSPYEITTLLSPRLIRNIEK